jgi:hypothetical protein
VLHAPFLLLPAGGLRMMTKAAPACCFARCPAGIATFRGSASVNRARRRGVESDRPGAARPSPFRENAHSAVIPFTGDSGPVRPFCGQQEHRPRGARKEIEMGKIALSGAAASELLAAEPNNRGSTASSREAEQPFAYVETTLVGPRLIVGGVCVRWWNGEKYEAEAQDMADQINEDLARRVRRSAS